MNCEFNEALIGFNLDFLNEPSNSDVNKPSSSKNRRSEKGISLLKKRIIATDVLVHKFNAKTIEVDKSEKDLLSTKNKLRDVCIEKDIIKQNYETLDKEADKLRSLNKNLEKNIVENGHKYAAAESNIRQLELLLKERESFIDKHKCDRNLKLETIRELEKSNIYLKKTKEHLFTQLCNVADVVFSRRTLTKKEKIILSKYMRMKNQKVLTEGIESTFREEQMEDSEAALSESDDVDEYLSPTRDQTQGQNTVLDKNKDLDVMSVDTGRGSSLAFSGSEKNLSSPEYYIDSPASQTVSECYKIKERYVDAATSPILVKFVDTATNTSDQEIDNVELHKTTPVITIDKASSNELMDGIEPLSSSMSESCLESNNGDDIANDSDSEIEMILNNMRLDKFITPIPPTPGRSAKTSICHEHISDCLLAEKVSKEQEVIKAAIVNLETKYLHIVEQLKENADVSHKQVETGSFVVDKEIVNLDSNRSINNNIVSNLTLDDEDLPVLVQTDSNQNINNNIVSNLTLNDEDLPVLIQTESNQSINNNIVSNLTLNDEDLPVLVHTTTTLNNNLPQISQDTNNDSQSEEDVNDSDEICPIQRTESATKQTGSNNSDKKTVRKAKKPTLLEKFRINLKPKNKIRKDLPPPRVLPSRTKKISNIDICSKNKKADSALTLNDKDVYEKAVKVMAEIKSQQKLINHKTTINRKKVSLASLQIEKDNHVPNNRAQDMKTDDEKVSGQQVDIINTKTSADQNHDILMRVTDTTDIPKIKECDSEKRRKSFPPEKESIVSNSRQRCTSLTINKVPVVVLTRFDVNTVQVNCNISPNTKKCRKRCSDDTQESLVPKRILRCNVRHVEDERTKSDVNETFEKVPENIQVLTSSETVSSKPVLSNPCKPVCYEDLDLFDDAPPVEKQKGREILENCIRNPQESVLCKFIDDEGITVLKHCSKEKISETVVTSLSVKITERITAILELPPAKAKNAMDDMVTEIQSWKLRDFIPGLMHYLMDPTRRLELFNKIYAPPAPPMTKVEQVLIYLLTRLRLHWPNKDLIFCVLNQIEYLLFRLNQTPEVKVVESMSHFYAILCRYINNKSRLRMFMVNAMYCLHFSAVPLVKQCMEVWMHILPLAHMGLAKSPMVSTLVYLLHFFKCDDSKIVQDIRTILKHKYFFNVSDWDETKMLEMFRNAIMEINNNLYERKMLRLSVLLLAKRHGTTWCQNKIINNLLMPIIKTEGAPESAKVFCISLLGPLFKPYPEGMRVHCAIVMNHLTDILAKKPSPYMQEAIYTTLICMSKHNQNRVIQALLSWRPEKLTPCMQSVLRDYVREKPVKAWRSILSKVPLTT